MRSPACGSARSCARKVSRSSTIRSSSVRATTSAVRGHAVSSASSPKSSPGPKLAERLALPPEHGDVAVDDDVGGVAGVAAAHDVLARGVELALRGLQPVIDPLAAQERERAIVELVEVEDHREHGQRLVLVKELVGHDPVAAAQQRLPALGVRGAMTCVAPRPIAQ